LRAALRCMDKTACNATATASARFRTCATRPRSQTRGCSIVLDGVRAENGMVSFAAALDRDDAAAVREYVITLALAAKAEQNAAEAAATAEAGEAERPADGPEPHAN